MVGKNDDLLKKYFAKRQKNHFYQNLTAYRLWSHHFRQAGGSAQLGIIRKNMKIYDDDYSTCAKTYAGLRIYPGEIHPNEVTKRLKIKPSKTQVAGERIGTKKSQHVKLNGWFLSTEKELQSVDYGRHIDWILDKLDGKEDVIHLLQKDGARVDISCFWVSKSGHGGPMLRPNQMSRLANLDIEIWWDIYFDDDE